VSARLGLSIPADAMAGVPELARRAEELGWTDAWSMESRMFDAFTPLNAAAAVTERMRLGTAIVAAFLRPPGVTAMHAAATADLAPGRFVLGLGSSTRVVVEQWHGVPFPDRPLTETARVAREVAALLSGERVGKLRLDRPPAEPVPIYLAALGPRMLRLVGEIAEGVVSFLVGPRCLPEVFGEVGREVDSVARIFTFPGADRGVMDVARRLITGYALVPYYARSLTRQGFGEEVARVQAAWSAGDRAGAPGQISDAMVRELTLMGSDEEIAEGIEAYRRAGLRTPVLAFPSTSIARRMIEVLAPA
jgi:probable F420-dependent oxidoreductase